MEVVRQVFDTSLSMVVQLWNCLMNQWGWFGTGIIFIALLRKVTNTFNKLKSS